MNKDVLDIKSQQEIFYKIEERLKLGSDDELIQMCVNALKEVNDVSIRKKLESIFISLL